jgi:hypothetical protein
MEVLKPAVEQPKQPQKDPEPGTEKTPNLKHIEILSSLGMKDQIFNDEIMEKVAFIADRIEMPDFEELSIRLGNDNWSTSKLDKIYYHIQLSDQYMKGEERQKLIKQQLDQYGIRSNTSQ